MSFKTDIPNILPDFITPRNFLYFIISREYIEYVSNLKCPEESADEETKLNFYLFLFRANKDESIDLFKYVKENESPFKKKLNNLVIKRIEMLLENMNELIAYTDILDLMTNVLSSFHEKNDAIANESKGKICKYSLVGVFLRKFCLSFQSLSLEKMLLFIDSLRGVFENSGIIIPNHFSDRLSRIGEGINDQSLLLKLERSSRIREGMNDQSLLLKEERLSRNGEGMNDQSSLLKEERSSRNGEGMNDQSSSLKLERSSRIGEGMNDQSLLLKQERSSRIGEEMNDQSLLLKQERSSRIGEEMNDQSLLLKQERLSRDQVLWELEKIHKDLENVLYAPNEIDNDNNTNGKKNNGNSLIILELRHKLAKYKRMYPDIYESFFLDNLLTINTRDMEVIENDIQMMYPTKFLGIEDVDSAGLLQELNKDVNNKDNIKKLMLKRKTELHQKLSEVSLNCVITFSAMGYKNEALLYYKDAIHNAKLSGQKDLVAEVGSVGNSLMPINDNPNGTFYAAIDASMNDKTALGSIRDFLLQSLHNNRSTLSELLHHFFCSPAPQRRELTPICLIYFSIVFRYFGFESIAHTYLVIAGYVESIKRTKSHQEVLVEVFSQQISSYSTSGRFDKAFNLFKSLRTFGNGILNNNNQLQVSMLQASFNYSLMRLNFTKAYQCLENLQRVSLAEYGLRKVQILFMEDNTAAAIRLGNHIISFAIKKRELLVYNHVSINKGCATISSQVPFHKSSGIVDHLNEMTFLKELPSLDDTNSQNWGSRDWAIYECRCRWLMCIQLINRQQIKTAKVHLNLLKDLSVKFHFYHFMRLSQVLELAITNRERQSQNLELICPLKASLNTYRAESILSNKFGLSHRDHMLFVNLLVNAYISQLNMTRDENVENHLKELSEYCEKSGDRMGQAHCWRMIYCYNNAIGNEEAKVRSLNELELLLENKLTNVPNLDFLSHVL